VQEPRCMKMLTLLFLCLIPTHLLLGQNSPFQKVNSKDWIYGGTSLVLLGGSTWSRYSTKPYSAENLPVLNISDLPRYDRKVPMFWSPSHDRASDFLAIGALALPFLTLTNSGARHDGFKLAHMYFQALALTVSLTDFTKTAIKRDRPFMYGSLAPLSDKTHASARLSFPSGHTSTSAAMAFFSARTFTSYSDNTRINALVWTGAALYPAFMGYLRIRAGKHFISDVVAGYILGAAIGYLIPTLHKSKNFVIQ
jgi:membrane-associated phospholipid phosphatase